MKVLCLHGSYGSASNFQVQLGPIIKAVEASGSVKFKWVDGAHAAIPPPGFEAYFGTPPLYRFLPHDGMSVLDDVLYKIRELPEGTTPEETMRKLIADQEVHSGPAVAAAIERLFQILDADQEIDSILGYSEGATTAATLILEERRRWEEEGRPRRIKSAIFFTGWPPLRVRDGCARCLLADECEDIIDVPTCHIVGYKDPYIHGSLALYGLCDEDTATMFDHGGGHTLPRDPRTIKELELAIQGTFARSK